jgi:hypothetical protein
MPFTEPSKYAVGFYHTDWLDNVDRVQAGGANGFNKRFRSLEEEFSTIQSVMDNIGVVAKELQSAIESIENRLRGTWTLENLNVPGKLGVGTTAPGAKLSVVGPGATEIGGSALSQTFVLTAGTLGTAPNSELSLANIGFGSGNNSSLGIHARRIASGTDWTTTAIGLGMDVDNTIFAGASLWLHGNRGVGIGTAEPQARLHLNDGAFLISNFPDNDTTPSLTKLSLSNRGAGGHRNEWALYTAATGGGFGVHPNAFEIWEYPASQSRFQIKHGGDTILSPSGGRVGIGRSDNLVGNLHVAGNGAILSLEGEDHSYMGFYPRGLDGGRLGTVGFGWEDSRGFIIRSDFGSVHISSDEQIHLFPQDTVFVSKGWGGKGNLRVDGNLSVGGGRTQLGLEYESHWLMAGGSDPNSSCALGFYYSPSAPNETMLMVGQKLLAPLVDAGKLVANRIEATVKHFVIDHPLDPKNKQLVHSAIEGAESAVYYRGEAYLSEGQATITLPDYFEALTRREGRTVMLTPKFEGDAPVSMLAASEIKDAAFTVRMIDDRNGAQAFYWEVKAVRSDVEELEVERPKEDRTSVESALKMMRADM